MALAAIGVFNENFAPTHYIVSVMLFVFLPISLVVFAVTFWREGKCRLSGLTFALALIAAFAWILEFTLHYASNVAIPELVSGLAGAVWVWVIGYLMIKETDQKPKENAM